MLQLCRVGKGTHSFHVCIHESGLQVLLPEVYEGTFYYRKSATSIPDDDVQVKSDGQEATGAFDMLPSPGECASKFDGSPPTELPGWFFFREERRADHGGAWLVRFCSLPKPTPDDQAYIGRTVDSVSLLEITHSSELDLKSPMQILLTAGGGCSYTVRAGGNPYPLVTIPAADLHALTVLPPIGGGSWQLRALVRLQAWEILHSMFCGMASERTKCLVSDTLDQELINAGGRTSKQLATEKAAAAAAAEAETPYEPPPDRKQPTPAALAWMQQRVGSPTATYRGAAVRDQLSRPNRGGCQAYDAWCGSRGEPHTSDVSFGTAFTLSVRVLGYRVGEGWCRRAALA